MAVHFGDGRDWFFEKRFGMFVHWGIYSIPAWHEQHQARRGVPRAEYEPLMYQFNPTEFNPDAWIDLAEEAGMKYLCFTTKHHDGFCMWNTAQTDFNVMNSPYSKDILAQLAEACHRRSFPLCLYYSVVDWHHPNYPNSGMHHELSGPEAGDEPDMAKYLDFLRAQVRELCTQYGEIAGIWWDMNVKEVKDPSISQMIRELQPNAIINDRGFDEGDFGTPERDWDDTVNHGGGFPRPTEACQSVGSMSWGYKTDENYYTPRHLMQSIDKYLAQGANYLLNVGPKADGTIPEESARILRTVGKWYHAVSESLIDTEYAPNFNDDPHLLVTHKQNVLYIHLTNQPETNGVILKRLSVKPKVATLLNTGAPVDASIVIPVVDTLEGYRVLRLANLPVNELANEVIVIKLEFDEQQN